MNEPKLLSIGEVARQTGVRTSALRYYESLGLLPVPSRESGQRRYAPDVIKQVRFIQAAQEVGFSLEEMKTLLVDSLSGIPYVERLQGIARRKLRDVEAVLIRATAMKRILEAGITCECACLEDCLLFMPAENRT